MIELDRVALTEGCPWLPWTDSGGTIECGLTRAIELRRWWPWLKAFSTRRTMAERAAALTWTLATGYRWLPIEQSGRARLLVSTGWTRPRLELRVGDLGPGWTVWASVEARRHLGRILGAMPLAGLSGLPVVQLGPTRRIVVPLDQLETELPSVLSSIVSSESSEP